MPSMAPRNSFDKVNVPLVLVGSTFAQLFLSFLERDHGIAVGISRVQDPSLDADEDAPPLGERLGTGCLPLVITAPAMHTVMRLGDEVFVLKDAS